MEWTVELTKGALKQAKKLSKRPLESFHFLIKDLTRKGPAPGAGWSNYGKLRGKKNQDNRHCHLVKGNPTYVCCWVVVDKSKRIIEVYYVGTHEKAPY